MEVYRYFALYSSGRDGLKQEAQEAVQLVYHSRPLRPSSLFLFRDPILVAKPVSPTMYSFHHSWWSYAVASC